MKIGAVMISCAKRASQCADTVAELRKTDWDLPLLVIDDAKAIEAKGLTITRPQERQEHVSLYALQRGLEEGWDAILFLEDDLIFNRHIKRNLLSWAPLVDPDSTMSMGSLYNPTIQELSRGKDHFIADPNAIYGSQAFIIPAFTAEYMTTRWWDVMGMQDIKMSRLAAQAFGHSIYYHQPSLVQHVGVESAWATDGRFHQCHDFDPLWRAVE